MTPFNMPLPRLTAELLQTEHSPGSFRLVKSATHIWGKRRFATRDDSRNNWWVALLTFGEGWHNNHHAHPRAARHGLVWYEIDINWWGIRGMEFLGLAKAIKLVSVTHQVDA
jgi:fatty-acid desaturase